MLNLNMSPMVKGILIGVGVSAVGFYAYKHNEEKVDNFLRSHGVKVRKSFYLRRLFKVYL